MTIFFVVVNMSPCHDKTIRGLDAEVRVSKMMKCKVEKKQSRKASIELEHVRSFSKSISNILEMSGKNRV